VENRSPNVDDVYLAALERESAEQRSAYLEEACAGHPELRRRVERLLETQAKIGSFLEAPAPEICPTVGEPNREHPGTVIGPYKLLQQIGDGGMGVVWMAEQTHPVQRKVALKVIKPGMDTNQVIARFEAERQALAMMDHVNIARVFDGGATESGRPYFVMELVHGVPITKYCDDNHLTPRERLELFVPVCQAIQHAHQKGIIHRDIKPSNVMVTLYDGKPVPKVIDFGVAKATEQKLTERTLFTQYGTMVGTLEYMSPEQAETSALGVDTRSDIYSLGVLLYELLTGSTPLTHKRMKEAAYAEILRMIKEEEPPKPSTRLSDSGEALASISAQRKTEPAKLTKLVRGELDWIVMKCLEKDRNRRYETANGFALDVQRYLADEPVTAGPPSASYRLRKFVRRNKRPVIAAGVVLAILVAGIVGTTLGLVGAMQAEDKAQKRFEEAERARAGEAAQRQKAEAAEAATLADYKANADEVIALLIGSKANLGPQEKAYLDNASKRWKAFAARQGDEERSRALRGEGHYRVAWQWQQLGRNEEARAEYELARDVQQKLVEQFPGVAAYQQDLAGTHNNLGNLFRELIMLEKARAEYQAARDIQKKLVDQFPNEPAYQKYLAYTHHNLGILLGDLGRSKEAWAEQLKARDLRAKLVEQFRNEPGYQQDLAGTHQVIGRLLADRGNREEARTEYLAALRIRSELLARFPFEPAHQRDLASTHNILGGLLRELRKPEEALAEYQAARDLRSKLVKQYRAVPAYQQLLAYTHNDLGALLRELGKRDEAFSEHTAALGLRSRLVEQFTNSPTYKQELADTYHNLGLLLIDLKKPDEARAKHQAARDLLEDLDKRHPGLRAVQLKLGASYYIYGIQIRDGGKATESLAWFDKAIGMVQPHQEKGPSDVLAQQILRNSHWNRAWAYSHIRKHAEAVKDWDRAIEFSPPAERAELRANRATAQLRAGLIAEAVAEVADLTAPVVNAPGAPKWNAGQWYGFASVYAVASGKNAAKQQLYADRAMELLQQAVEAGYTDAARMAKDADLAAMRGRDDFKKLIMELKGKK
jgi:serine/threonine protein kinase/tetratricopeptide (TPR) repeat protein